MTIHIWQNGQQKDISGAVIKGSIRCHKVLSMDFNKPIGESTLEFEILDDFEIEGVRFRPKTGERVRFILDDGTDTIFFDGFLLEPKCIHAGFYDTEILKYQLSAKDVTHILKDKIMPEITFSDYTAGALIDQLAAYCDPRIIPASDNDLGQTIGVTKLARMDIYQAIEEIAKAGTMLVWIDEEWNIHHKQYSTILNLSQDEKFNITDTSKKYKNLELNVDWSNICTRVHCIGSQMDSGKINAENRKQGKQKRIDNIVTKTASVDNINAIRRARGFSELPLDTNTELLNSSTAGIIEKDIDCQDIYDTETLERRAIAELNVYSKPWLKGSVSYYIGGLVPGRSILLSSERRGYTTALPVIELELSTSDGSGFDEEGNKQYFYTAQLNGPSSLERIKRNMTPEPPKTAKKEKLIKPNPPVNLSVKAEEPQKVVLSTSYAIRYNQ